MNYSVKYKLPGDIFFRTIKNVKGDSLVENGNRLLITQDEERYEISKNSVIVFSKNRFFSILESKRNETGQDLKPNTSAKPE